MQKKILLFDIDNTLLNSKGKGGKALFRSIREIYPNFEIKKNFIFDGKTDPTIVHELLQLNNLEIDDYLLSKIKQLYLIYLEEELNNESVSVFRGVNDIIHALHNDDEFLLGILSGNIKEGGILKIKSANLNKYFSLHFFGDNFFDRNELSKYAAQTLSSLYPHIPNRNIIIIGDTPNDILCGKTIGATTIGIAQGRYSAEILKKSGADFVYNSFMDIEIRHFKEL